MADAVRTTVSSSGTATVRQRPALMLVKVRLRAAEATLDLGLAKLKQHREATSRWLTGLGAARVEVGEPHFADQADKDPMSQMQAATARALRRRPGVPAPEPDKRGVSLVLTAVWEIGSMSAE